VQAVLVIIVKNILISFLSYLIETKIKLRFLLVATISLSILACNGDSTNDKLPDTDKDAPVITSVSPNPDQMHVPVNSFITINFNEPISKVDTNNIELRPFIGSGLDIRNHNTTGELLALRSSGGIEVVGNALILKPMLTLKLNTKYFVNIVDVKDSAGNLMTSSYSWEFIVDEVAVGTLEVIQSPTDANLVSRATDFNITFTDIMNTDVSKIGNLNDSFTLTNMANNSVVSLVLNNDVAGKRATYSLAPALLEPSTQYEAKLSKILTTQYGIEIENDIVTIFTTDSQSTISFRPEPPVSVSAIPNNNSVTVNWIAPTSAVGNEIYNIYVSKNNKLPFELLTSGISGLVYTDLLALNGSSYVYAVTIIDTQQRESLQTLSNTVTPNKPPPAVPTNLTATALIGGIEVSWLALANLDYRLYVKSGSTGYALLKVILKTEIIPKPSNVGSSYSFSHINLDVTKLYQYEIIAVDERGIESLPGGAVTIPVIPESPKTPTGVLKVTPGVQQLTVTWDSLQNLDYNLYVKIGNGLYNAQPIVINSTVIGTKISYSYIHKSLQNGTLYQYLLKAVQNGVESIQGIESQQVAPITPPSLSVSFEYKKLNFSWTSVASVDHYRLYENITTIAGSKGFTRLGSDISAANTLVSVPVVVTKQNQDITKPSLTGVTEHMQVNDNYLIEACFNANCSNKVTSNIVFRKNSLDRTSNPLTTTTIPGSSGYGPYLSISGDGKTIAVGLSIHQNTSINMSSVTVFKFLSNKWVEYPNIYNLATPPPDVDGFITISGTPWSLALSDDGNILAIGLPNNHEKTPDVTSPHEVGYVEMLSFANGKWTKDLNKLQSTNQKVFNSFGSSVSLSADGNTLAVGEIRGDTASIVDCGTVTVFTRQSRSSAWNNSPSVVTSIIPTKDNLFGIIVDLSSDGNTLAVGEPTRDLTQPGSVTIFNRISTSDPWVRDVTMTLVPANPQLNAQYNFGATLSLSGDGNTLATSNTLSGTAILKNSGSVILFSRASKTSNWQRELQLLTSAVKNSDDYFGYGLSLSFTGDTLIVGKSKSSTNFLEDGEASIFYKNVNGNWIRNERVLTAPAFTGANKFGVALEISADGQTVLIGGINSPGFAAVFVY